MDTAQAMKLAAKDIADMQKRSPSTVVPHESVHQLNLYKERKQKTVSTNIECYRCEGNHYGMNCKFINADCKSCGKKGHLARVSELALNHQSLPQPHQLLEVSQHTL